MSPFFRGPTPFAHRYRDLVRMAYLVLPAEIDEQRRMLLAHRVVSGCLPRNPPGEAEAEERYREVRTRVLTEALGAPRYRPVWLGGWGSWLRTAPARALSDELALGAAIAAMSPQARAAYVLAQVEGLPPADVRAELTRLGVGDPEEAQRGADGLGFDAEEQRTLLSRPALDPTIARLYGRRPWPTRPGALAAGGVAVVLLVAVGGAGLLYGRSSEASSATAAVRAATRFTTAGDRAWRDSTRLDLSVWPARGDLTGDDVFPQAALAAWNDGRAQGHDGADAGPPLSDPQLLYAGNVGGARVALLRDGDRVARYTVRDRRTALDVYPEGSTLPDAAGPLKLTETGAGGRYLLPPWVPSARAATLDGGSANWSPVPVHDGVTGPVPLPSTAPGGCRRATVLDLDQPEIAPGRSYTMADLGGLTMARVTYQPPPPAPVRPLGPHQIDGDDEGSPEGFGIWGRLGCVAPTAPQAGVESASAWEFWSGRLPESDDTAHWVCARYTYADGRSAAYAALLGGDAEHRWAVRTGTAHDTWDCSRLKRDLVTGTWWRAPSGHWYYVGAASRRIIVFTASGPFAPAKVHDEFLVASGPKSGGHPSGKVTLTGQNYDGQWVTVFQ